MLTTDCFEGQGLPRTSLAHHELESVISISSIAVLVVIIIITIISDMYQLQSLHFLVPMHKTVGVAVCQVSKFLECALIDVKETSDLPVQPPDTTHNSCADTPS